MGSSIFLKIFLAQIAVAAVVVFFLKKVSDGQLLELAYRTIDYWKTEPGQKPPQTVTLITFRPIPPKAKERFLKIAAKRLGQAAMVFESDRSLLGGAKIKIGDKVFDYSLRDRLRQALSS